MLSCTVWFELSEFNWKFVPLNFEPQCNFRLNATQLLVFLALCLCLCLCLCRVPCACITKCAFLFNFNFDFPFHCVCIYGCVLLPSFLIWFKINLSTNPFSISFPLYITLNLNFISLFIIYFLALNFHQNLNQQNEN